MRKSKKHLFFQEHYARVSIHEFVGLFQKHFGIKTSPRHVRHYAAKNNIAREVPAPFYSPLEVSELAQVSLDSVYRALKSGKLRKKIFGHRIGVYKNSAEAFIQQKISEQNQELNPPKWDAIPAYEAASSLGYEINRRKENTIAAACRRKVIPSFKKNGIVYVPSAYVKAAEEYLRKTGNVNVQWHQLRVDGFDNFQPKSNQRKKELSHVSK